ncbi:MAG: hypothetical protein Q9M28_06925 [Mariprofundaceae bacterium]|nr:hypothetical protein [Mariprofundaceae bacterium]
MKKTLFAVLFLLPALAIAAPNVGVQILAEKIIIIEKDGEKIESRVPADDVAPNDTLIYTLSYENKGDETATGIQLDDPIPENTVYIVGTAFGPGSDIYFSIDGGKHFKEPSTLTYDIEVKGKTEQRQASPEQYTHIRWVVKEVKAGQMGIASFRVLVK